MARTKQTHRTAKTKAKQRHAEHHDATEIPKKYFSIFTLYNNFLNDFSKKY